MADNTPNATSTEKQVTPTGLIHLGVIYLIWSSTYLAIRIAVTPGSGFPPFTLGVMRVSFAGVILLLWAWVSKQRIKPTRKELGVLIISGVLLWNGGNGLVMYAEQRADSGIAALLIGAIPMWSALIDAIIDRKLPSFQLILSLLLGFAGIGVLAAPELLGGVRADFLAILALIGAPIFWALGSILQARRPVGLQPRASSAYQMFAGAIGFILLVIILGEPAPAPSTEAWLAWGYLVIFGAVFAFTSYVTALQLLPTKVVMTYAYVNPVLAVILGWAILDEAITIWTIVGSLMILLGVWGVFRERYQDTH